MSIPEVIRWRCDGDVYRRGWETLGEGMGKTVTMQLRQ